MCLIVDKDYPTQPKKAIRYKVVEKLDNSDRYWSIHSSLFHWKKGKWYGWSSWLVWLRPACSIDAQGFHVFVSLKDAQDYQKYRGWLYETWTVVKVECKGFVAGGRHNTSSTVNEIWRQARIIEEL